MAGKKPTLEDSVKSLIKRGETTDFIASKLDVSLQKVLSIVAELPIDKYTIHEASRSNMEHVMFLESRAFNEILDWNRPIYHVDNAYLLQERSGQWYGFRFKDILVRIGLNLGNIGQTFIATCLPLLLRQDLDANAGPTVKRMKDVANYNHINTTWNIFVNMWNALYKAGDLSENLSPINDNREIKEHVAEMLSEDSKDSPYSGFVDECISLWLNHDSKIEHFRNGTQGTTLWIETWLAILETPAPQPGVLVVDAVEAKKAILAACSPYDSKVIDFMVENDEYFSADVNLALNGNIKSKDIEFAKAGGFTTAKQVKTAKRLACTTLAELKAVQKYGWESADELREAASSLGLEPHEYDLYIHMVVLNDQVAWRGGMGRAMVDWARSVDKETMERLVGFESPRSLVFFEEILLEKSDRAVRTDYLLEDYNGLVAPGERYDESSFEIFLELQPFMGVVKAGEGGVSMISPKKQEAARKKHFSQS